MCLTVRFKNLINETNAWFVTFCSMRHITMFPGTASSITVISSQGTRRDVPGGRSVWRRTTQQQSFFGKGVGVDWSVGRTWPLELLEHEEEKQASPYSQGLSGARRKSNEGSIQVSEIGLRTIKVNHRVEAKTRFAILKWTDIFILFYFFNFKPKNN